MSNLPSQTDQPLIDQRKFDDLFNEFKEIAKSIKQQWNIEDTDNNDLGVALSKIYISILQQVIIRLNKVPQRNFIEFLNFLGFELSSSIPAKVPVTFHLVEDVKEDVVVPKGTKVLADANEKHRELTFETEDTILVTRSKLKKAYSIIPKTNEIYNHINRINNKQQPFHFFSDSDRGNIQEHSIYFGHDDLFNLSQEKNKHQNRTFTISLSFQTNPEHEVTKLVKLFSNKNFTRWSCNWLGNKEIIFNVTSESPSDTINLVPETIETNESFKIEKNKINNIESFWIRCQLLEKNNKLLTYQNFPFISDISIQIKFGDSTSDDFIYPDLLYYNNFPININSYLQYQSEESICQANQQDNLYIYPFGKLPSTYDTFYISSNNAFSKKEYDLQLIFEGLDPNFEGNLQHKPILSWEYWNGKAWMPLFLNPKDPNNFNIFNFKCPDDITEIDVNGNKNFWIRIRIVSGDYGRVKFIEDNTITNDSDGSEVKGPWIPDYSEIQPPKFKRLKIKRQQIIKLDCAGNIDTNQNNKLEKPLCITYSNLEFKQQFFQERKEFQPFTFLHKKNKNPAIFFGMDKKVIGGPVSIYFSVIEDLCSQYISGNFNFFYHSSNEWKTLDTIDYTNYLKTKGYMKFNFPKDFESSWQFGEELYWIKIEDERGIYSREISSNSSFSEIKNKIPYLQGLYLNTVSCTNTSHIINEIPIKNLDNSYSLSQTPLPSLDGFNEEIWINEGGENNKENESELNIEENDSKVKEILDFKGNIIERWVLWQRRPDLLASTNKDRHYLLDYLTGIIRFGDGNRGKSLPLIENNIQVNYVYGGGKEGNIDPQEIKTLKTNIPLIDSVTNYEKAEGGSDQQTVTNAMDEWPNIFKNREQAVTYQDFENLILNKFPFITRVKCVPNTNIQGLLEPGHVTIVIVPIKSNDELKSIPTRGLLEKVKQYIFERSSNVLVSSNHLHIIKPLYFKVSVFAKIYVNDMNSIPIIQRLYSQKLKSFLDPLHGGNDGSGWDFGKFPCEADIYYILSEIKEVDHIVNLKIKTECDEPSELILYYKTLKSKDFDQNKVLIDNEKIPPYSLIYSGDHEVEIEIIDEEEKRLG